MKNRISFLCAAMTALFLCPASGHAAAGGQLIFDNYMPIPNPVAYSSTFSIRADGIDWASEQIVITSVTQTNVLFNDGAQATASWTVNDYVSLSTAAATGQFTAASTAAAQGVSASTSIVVSSNIAGTIIQITGPPLAGLPPPMTIGGNIALGLNSTNTATNISNFVTTNTTSGLLTSFVSGSSVTFTFMSSGTFGNAYTITSTTPSYISSGTFVSGAQPVSVTLGGATYVANTNFQVGATTAAMAGNLAAAINASSTTALVTATATVTCPGCGIVYATATTLGSIGNSYVLATSSPPAISTSGATMLGGHDAASISINGVSLLANATWYPVTSNNQTATNLAAGINAVAGTKGIVTAVAAANVVFTTANVIGPAGDYATTSSTQGALTLAPFTSSTPINASFVSSAQGAMYGGYNSSYTINTSVINSTGNALGLAEGVWLSTQSGTGIQYSTAVGGTNITLAWGTTVYVIPGPVGSNTFQLSLTSTGAVAGLPIVLTSSASKTTADSFVLNVSTFALSGSLQWVASNDNTNWVPYTQTPFNITIPSLTFGSPYVSTGTVVIGDFGHFNYGYLGISVTAPTQGVVKIGARVVGNAP